MYRFFVVAVSFLVLIGCASTGKYDGYVANTIETWNNVSVERFLEANPEVHSPLPLGGGRYRYTIIHDVHTWAEWLDIDVFYRIYVFVNERGVIYNVTGQRTAELETYEKQYAVRLKTINPVY